MRKPKITISAVAEKHLKIIMYLVVSGVLGYSLSQLANKPELTTIFAPAINYIIWVIEQELRQEGIGKVLRK